MAILTLAKSYSSRVILGEQRRFVIKTAVQLYEGGYVQLDSNGYLVPYTAVADPFENPGRILGRVMPTRKDVDAATTLKGDTSLSPNPEAIVFTGSEILLGVPVTGASTLADCKKAVYLAQDDNTMTLTSTNNGKPLGVIDRFNSATSFDVRVYSVSEREGL